MVLWHLQAGEIWCKNGVSKLTHRQEPFPLTEGYVKVGVEWYVEKLKAVPFWKWSFRTSSQQTIDIAYLLLGLM